MKCKNCGSTIDASAEICNVCGAPISREHTGYIRTVEELAYEYGLGAQEEEVSAELPELFREHRQKRTRLGQAVHAPVEKKPASTVAGNPTLNLDEYVRLLGAESADTIEAVPSVEEEQSAQAARAASMAASQPVVEAELHPVLQKIDSIIEKPADMVLEKIRERYPRPTRVKRAAATERLMVLAAALGACIVVVILIAVIAASIAPDVTGEWLVAQTASGERFTVEFTRSGEVIARAYVDDAENIYMTGEYKARRSNGYNLLTITYDDGEETKLYYVIDGKDGTFTNVDSGKSDTYTLVK